MQKAIPKADVTTLQNNRKLAYIPLKVKHIQNV